MAPQFCPECGGALFYDISVKRYLCKSCGLFVTRDEILDLRDRDKSSDEDVKKKKLHRNDEYLEWWLGKKKK